MSISGSDASLAPTAPAPTIPALTIAAAKRFGDALAVDDGEVRLTYAELLEQARSFGAALVAAGIEPLDRVAIWSPNGHRWIVAVLGLWQAGATLVPINTRFKGTEAAVILRRSGARALITATDFLDTDYVAMLRGTGEELPALETIVVTRGEPADGTVGWDAFLAAADDADRDEVIRRADAVQRDDASDILFTSGTTGTPKGVVMTHGRTLTVASDWVAMTGLQAGDRYLQLNPYFHMFGLKAGILASVTAGAAMFPVPVFAVDRVLDAVAREHITVLPGAPTIYQTILDHPDRASYDLSSLRVAVTGAADIPVELIRRIDQELPFTLIVSGYGLTEGGTATGTRPGDDVETIATTVGRARPSFELRITAPDGAALPAGEPGEVELKGASIMAGYLDDPEATAAALSAEGWLKTGDLGVIDDAGNLRIVGRSKDMFIVGGFNAYPAEIENLLTGHPAVGEAAVIGIPDERLGEVGMAFVVPTAGTTPNETDIITWARNEMANYKVPRRVEVIDALPRNATGKVEKNVLRERAAGGNP